jgi:hypothetical protein
VRTRPSVLSGRDDDCMARLFTRLRRTRKQRTPEPVPSPVRGFGEPPSAPEGADDAELDSLRGELVRELDRLAGGDDGSAAFRRC